MSTALGQKVRGRSSGGGTSIGPWVQFTPEMWAAGDPVDFSGSGFIGGWYRDDIDGNGLHVTDLQISVRRPSTAPPGDWLFWLPDIGDRIWPFAVFVGSFIGINNERDLPAGFLYLHAGAAWFELTSVAGARIDGDYPWAANDTIHMTVRYGSFYFNPPSS